jgi:hypothetical protein
MEEFWRKIRTAHDIREKADEILSANSGFMAHAQPSIRKTHPRYARFLDEVRSVFQTLKKAPELSLAELDAVYQKGHFLAVGFVAGLDVPRKMTTEPRRVDGDDEKPDCIGPCVEEYEQCLDQAEAFGDDGTIRVGRVLGNGVGVIEKSSCVMIYLDCLNRCIASKEP